MTEYGHVQKWIDYAVTADTDQCIILEPRNGRMREVWIGNGKTTDAHRAVWIRKYGDPGSAYVLHSCSDGSSSFGCINPRHLRLGTVRENALDRTSAKRFVGETHGAAKLTEDNVRSIRARHILGAHYPHEGSTRKLAEEFGISERNLMHIVRRYSWKHI